MDTRCESARRWLASLSVLPSGFVLDEASPHAAHVAACPECRALLQRYEAFTSDCRTLFEQIPSDGAEERWVSAARSLHDGDVPVPSVADEARRLLTHLTAEDAEETFIVAARRQQATPSRAWIPAVAWKSLAAAVAVAVLVLGLWIPIRTIPEGTTEGDARVISIVSHSGRVLVNDEPVEVTSMGLPGVGTTIVTGEESRLRFGEEKNAVLSVEPRTEMVIADWSIEVTRIRLRRGMVRARVGLRVPGATFDVLTRSARIVVVGTEFTVRCTPEGETVVRGISGRVRVERVDGTTVGLVTAGETIRVESAVASAPGPTRQPVLATPIPSRARPLVKVEPNVDGKTARTKKKTEKRTLLVTRQPVKAMTPPPPGAQPDPGASLAGARALLVGGQVDRAIGTLLETDASDWRRDALLGDAYQIGGRYGEAVQAYCNALDRAADPVPALLADLATLQESQPGDAGAAANTWRRYLETAPNGLDAPRALLYLGRAALREGQVEEAGRHLLTLLEDFPGESRGTTALTLLGARFLRDQRWDEAEALFEPQTTTGGGLKAETALVGLIRVRIAQGDREAATRLIAAYRERFAGGRRGSEVERLESAL